LTPITIQLQLNQSFQRSFWHYCNEKNERNTISKTLANEVEDVITNIDDCKILQRRKYADIQQQVDNEIQISKIEDLSDFLREKLKTIQAESVLFGEIEQDFSFNVRLRLRLENLYTKQIKTKTISIDAAKMIDAPLRIQVIKNDIFEFLKLKDSDQDIQNTDTNNDDFKHRFIEENPNSTNYEQIGRVKPFQPQGTTASSVYNSGYRPYYAADLNNSTPFLSKTGKLIGEEIKFTYKNPIEVHKLEFYAPNNPDGASVKEADIYFSDGSSQRINLEWNGNYAIAELTPNQTNEVRMVINDVTNSTRRYVSIYELKIFGRELKIPKPTNHYTVVTPQNVKASSIWGESYKPQKTLDGMTNTYWCTKSGRAKDEYLRYEFSEPTSVSKIKIYRPLNSDGLPIRKAKIYYDDNSFQNIEFIGFFGWEELEIKPVESKILEIVVEDTFSLLGGKYVSLYEIKFFKSLN